MVPIPLWTVAGGIQRFPGRPWVAQTAVQTPDSDVMLVFKRCHQRTIGALAQAASTSKNPLPIAWVVVGAMPFRARCMIPRSTF
jgi:hypothetical protein